MVQHGKCIDMKKFEFSKLIVSIAVLINLIIVVWLCYMAYITQDTTPLCYLAVGDGGALATCCGFYYWKAKNENRYKHTERIVEKFAEKFGIDSAIVLVETILKD